VNPNDPNKPIVAQLFRTWQGKDGKRWVSACWYYRPEQTVHWVEKKFYQDEVVKTGQYRDHNIDELLGKCFVMFFTRYSRGRPKGVDENKVPIYVCESRYNETEKYFNKIKTWKSCIPDEVRGEDYELVPFDKQRNLKKIPSPIAHLLPENAKEGDPLPDAKMGVENAPPVIGAVFKRTRRESDSPPPEKTPLPPSMIHTPGPQPSRPVNSDYSETMSMTQMYKQAASVATPPPHPTQTPGVGPAMQHLPPQLRMQPQGSYPQQYGPSPTSQRHIPPNATPNGAHPIYIPNTHPHQPQYPGHQLHPMHSQQDPRHYQLPVPPSAYIIEDRAMQQIPEETAQRYLRDTEGRVIFFTVPPQTVAHEKVGQPTHSIGHTATYLATLPKHRELHAKRKLEVMKEDSLKEKKRKQEAEEAKAAAEDMLVKSLGLLTKQIKDNTYPILKKQT
jgi:chromatin structure-remodeling complex subunit RSC1/2